MSGNGVDLGSIYNLLLQVSKTVSGHDAKLDRHERILEQHGKILEHHGQMLQQVVTTINDMQKTMATKSELTDLRSAVTQYHSSVLGHGIMISELESRMRRVEEHLGLPSTI